MKERKKKKTEIIAHHSLWNRRLQVVFLFIAVAVMLYPRILLFTEFFSESQVTYRSPDSCYHVRRIEFIAHHNMTLPFPDPLLAYPEGATPIWSPLYDWISALPSFILGWGQPSAWLVMISAGFVSVIFGMGELLLIGIFMYRILRNAGIAIFSAFLAGISNYQICYTSLESIDHNSLLGMLLAWSFLQLYNFLTMERDKKPWKVTGLTALMIALFFWTWPGAYIHVFIIGAMLFFAIVASRKFHLFFPAFYTFGLASVLVLPLAFLNNRFSINMLSYQHVSFLAVLFLVLIASCFCLLHFAVMFRQRKNTRTSVIILLLFLFIILFSAWLYEPFRAGLSFASGQDRWLSTVVESKSLFIEELGDERLFSFYRVSINLTFISIIFPLAFLLLFTNELSVLKEHSVILVVSSIILFVLCAFQQKYVFEFMLPYSMISAIFIEWLYRKLIKRYSPSAQKYPIGVLLTVILMIGIAMYPVKENFVNISGKFASFRASIHAYKWLKDNAYAEKMDINSKVTPTKGVMSPWQLGHHVQLYAGLPTVADNFGYVFMDRNLWQGFSDMAAFYLAEDEEHAFSIAQKYKCAYILVPHALMFEDYPLLAGEDTKDYFQYSTYEKDGEKRIRIIPTAHFLNTIGARLSMGERNNSGKNSQLLKHFRLIYELPGPEITGQPVSASSLKIYAVANNINIFQEE